MLGRLYIRNVFTVFCIRCRSVKLAITFYTIKSSDKIKFSQLENNEYKYAKGFLFVTSISALNFSFLSFRSYCYPLHGQRITCSFLSKYIRGPNVLSEEHLPERTFIIFRDKAFYYTICSLLSLLLHYISYRLTFRMGENPENPGGKKHKLGQKSFKMLCIV